MPFVALEEFPEKEVPESRTLPSPFRLGEVDRHYGRGLPRNPPSLHCQAGPRPEVTRKGDCVDEYEDSGNSSLAGRTPPGRPLEYETRFVVDTGFQSPVLQRQDGVQRNILSEACLEKRKLASFRDRYSRGGNRIGNGEEPADDFLHHPSARNRHEAREWKEFSLFIPGCELESPWEFPAQPFKENVELQQSLSCPPLNEASHNPFRGTFSEKAVSPVRKIPSHVFPGGVETRLDSPHHVGKKESQRKHKKDPDEPPENLFPGSGLESLVRPQLSDPESSGYGRVPLPIPDGFLAPLSSR